jgi:hypothetical protein
LPDLIRQILDDPDDLASFLSSLLPLQEHGDSANASAFPRICPERVRVGVMQFCQRNFRTIDEDTTRWEDVARRFNNLLSIAVQQSNVHKVIEVDKAVVSRTLIFSANWFCLSTNMCRQLLFRLFEDLFLLSAVGKKVKPRSSVRVPYQMSSEARERMATFVLRTDFLNLIHRASTTKFKKNACVVDPADLSVGAGKIYCAKDMTSRIDQFVDKVQSFHSAAERWYLVVVKRKLKKFMALQLDSGLFQETLARA